MTSDLAVESRAAADPAGTRLAARQPVARWVRWSVLAAVLVVGLAVRWYFLDRQTMDYQNFLSRWYDTLDSGGFGAFRQQFAEDRADRAVASTAGEPHASPVAPAAVGHRAVTLDVAHPAATPRAGATPRSPSTPP